MAASLSVVFNAIDNMSSKLGSIASAGRTIESSFQNIEGSANQVFGNMESGSDAISQSFERTSSAASSLASNIGAYGGESANAASSAQALASSESDVERSMRETMDAVEEAADDIGEFGEQAVDAGNNSEEFGEKASNAISDLQSVLASAGIIAAIHEMVDGLAECAEKAEVVETAIAQLQTIAGKDSIGTLQQEIVNLSNETGQAAEALADTAYNAISAGTAVEESVGMAATASELAIAGFTDTSSALSVLETAMNSYGEAAGTAEHISDSLITVQNLGVTTVAQLSAQMGKGISTASAYNVSLENLESGYISITKAGINTAEGTTYIASMLNELGNSGSAVSKILREETGQSFGELMNQGNSLADVLGLIYDACDNNAEAMMNMWGSAEAGKAANAIIGQGLDTFNQNLETLKTSVGTTEQAYNIMADTTEYAHNKMDNAIENTSMQIGNVLNPTLSRLYEMVESVATGIGEFVSEHPVITQAILGLAAGLAAVTAAVTIADVAAKLFNTTLLANPIFWLVGGAAALTAGLFALSDAWETATDSSDELTFASQEQKTELERLNKEYDAACEKYGESSEQASELALQIRQLEDSYGEAGETVGQFRERIDELSNSLDEIYKRYEENITSADELYGSSAMLIGELQALQSQTNLTDNELQLMKQIVAELNGSYDELGLTISKTGKTNFSPSALFDYAKEQEEQQKMQAAREGLVGALGQYDELKARYEQAEDEAEKARDNYKDVEQNWIDEHPFLSQIGKGAEMNWSADVGKAYDRQEQSQAAYQKAGDAYGKLQDEIREYCEQLGYTSDETEAFIDELDKTADTAEKTAGKFNQTEEAVISYEEGTKTALNSVSEEVENLAKAYDDAYDAALESVSGQYELWDKVDKKVLNAKTSVDKIGAALDTQIEYWKNYSNNLDNLKGRDVEGLDAVLKNMDDGSEESAAALAGMAKASDEELGKIVEKYNKLQKAQTKTADGVAKLESDFGSKMAEIEKDMSTTIENMNMEEGARNAAQNTIQAYIESIRNMVPQAESAAKAVANAAEKALNRSYTPSQPTPAATPKQPTLPGTSGVNGLPGFSLPGYADGTTDSEPVYLAGEEGPELILSGGGDMVFPHSETESIIAAVAEQSDNKQMTVPSEMRPASTDTGFSGDGSSSQDKTITIRLEGSGSINVGAGTSSESIWDNVKGNLKTAFMQMLQEEVFEEGSGVYEF